VRKRARGSSGRQLSELAAAVAIGSAVIAIDMGGSGFAENPNKCRAIIRLAARNAQAGSRPGMVNCLLAP
jgi:hypothetical protein